ncbi:MAG: LysR family transcriptional regulator [Acidipropionibacterium jensenii]|nr:LysR family transcriptional regulator [Acidipropionibacterium jensenii]
MELRRLIMLYQLSRSGTIAATAEALSYSHSSVSAQLAELEREVGAPLLERAGRSVSLTPAGVVLAAHAEKAMAADEAALAQVAAVGNTTGGDVRITFVQTPAIALLAGTLNRLAQDSPEVHVSVVQAETAPAMDDLRAHLVDLVVGIEYEPLPVGRQAQDDRHDLLRERMVVGVAPGWWASTMPSSVDLVSLRDHAWATGHLGTGLESYLRNVCNRIGGFDPRIDHRSDDALILSALVSSGRAIALLPALFAAQEPAIVGLPVCGVDLRRTIFIATRRSARQSSAVRAVRKALSETAEELTRSRDHVTMVRASSRG